MAAFATAWADTAPEDRLIVDGFAGPGGWTEGLRKLGLRDVGLEWDEQACRTRAAAGHTTVRIDIATFVVACLVGKVWGLIMSPPCTKLSMGGKGIGRRYLDLLADGIRRMMRGEDCPAGGGHRPGGLMQARQLDVEGREVPATTVGPPAPPPAPAPKKKPTPPPEPCPGQIPVPLPREVLLCDSTDSTPPLLLW